MAGGGRTTAGVEAITKRVWAVPVYVIRQRVTRRGGGVRRRQQSEVLQVVHLVLVTTLKVLAQPSSDVTVTSYNHTNVV